MRSIETWPRKISGRQRDSKECPERAENVSVSRGIQWVGSFLLAPFMPVQAITPSPPLGGQERKLSDIADSPFGFGGSYPGVRMENGWFYEVIHGGQEETD